MTVHLTRCGHAHISPEMLPAPARDQFLDIRSNGYQVLLLSLRSIASVPVVLTIARYVGSGDRTLMLVKGAAAGLTLEDALTHSWDEFARSYYYYCRYTQVLEDLQKRDGVRGPARHLVQYQRREHIAGLDYLFSPSTRFDEGGRTPTFRDVNEVADRLAELNHRVFFADCTPTTLPVACKVTRALVTDALPMTFWPEHPRVPSRRMGSLSEEALRRLGTLHFFS